MDGVTCGELMNEIMVGDCRRGHLPCHYGNLGGVSVRDQIARMKKRLCSRCITILFLADPALSMWTTAMLERSRKLSKGTPLHQQRARLFCLQKGKLLPKTSSASNRVTLHPADRLSIQFIHHVLLSFYHNRLGLHNV